MHASSRLPAASSRDLQLEAEEAEAPFIHEELDRQARPCRGTTVEVHHLHEIKTLPQLVRRSSREPTWT